MEKNRQELIVKYLENRISDEELANLQEWVSMEGKVTQYKNFVSSYYKNDAFDAKKAFRLFETKTLNNKPLILPKRNKLPFLRYAAVFIGILTVGSLLYYFNSNPVPEIPIDEVTLEIEGSGTQILNTSITKDLYGRDGRVLAKQSGNSLYYNVTGTANDEIVYNVLKVPYGRTFKVILSDETQVYMNAGSRLRYPNRFRKDGLREVFLSGEAYFKVSKNKDVPFLVRTDNTSAEVFGTEFNISSYPEDKNTNIVLVEGSIGVFGKEERFDSNWGVVLKPNEMVTRSGTETLVVSEVDISGHIAWIDGTLLFKNEKFENIIKKLRRHYNVVISNNDLALGEKRFTGRFDIETVEQILKTFQKTNHFNYIVKDRTIIINP